jgi:hypothetical protein
MKHRLPDNAESSSRCTGIAPKYDSYGKSKKLASKNFDLCQKLAHPRDHE